MADDRDPKLPSHLLGDLLFLVLVGLLGLGVSAVMKIGADRRVAAAAENIAGQLQVSNEKANPCGQCVYLAQDCRSPKGHPDMLWCQSH